MRIELDPKVKRSWEGYIKEDEETGERIYCFGMNEVTNLCNPDKRWNGRSQYSSLTLDILREQSPGLLES